MSMRWIQARRYFDEPLSVFTPHSGTLVDNRSIRFVQILPHQHVTLVEMEELFNPLGQCVATPATFYLPPPPHRIAFYPIVANCEWLSTQPGFHRVRTWFVGVGDKPFMLRGRCRNLDGMDILYVNRAVRAIESAQHKVINDLLLYDRPA